MPKSRAPRAPVQTCPKCKNEGVVYREKLVTKMVRQPLWQGGQREAQEVPMYWPEWCDCPAGQSQAEAELADYAARRPWER